MINKILLGVIATATFVLFAGSSNSYHALAQNVMTNAIQYDEEYNNTASEMGKNASKGDR